MAWYKINGTTVFKSVYSDDVTALKSDVLEGKTALTHDSNDGIAVGIMPNNGDLTTVITTLNGTYEVPMGYTSGGTITARLPVGTQGIPTITTTKNVPNSITLTPKATDESGYIEGTTKTGSAVVVTASELVEGNLELTAATATQSDINVTNYATVSVNPTPSEEKITLENGDILPSTGKLLSKVIVDVPTGTPRSEADIEVNRNTVNIPAGLYFMDAVATVATGEEGIPEAIVSEVRNNRVTITPRVTNSEGYITGGTLNGESITIAAEDLVSGIKEVDSTIQGLTEVDITNYAKVAINPVPSELRTVTENGVVTPTEGHLLSKVTVNVSTGASRTVDDLIVSGPTITTPAGLYAIDASKSVDMGSVGLPVAAKGTVSNNLISITPFVTVTPGYITGGTIDGSSVVVKAADLVSGNLDINATTATLSDINVTNYATVKVNPTPSEEKTVTENGVVTPTAGKLLSKVNVNVSTGTPRTAEDIIVVNDTVTVPDGVYSTSVTKTVDSLTLPTETSTTGSGTTKATVSRSTADQFINIPTGYNKVAANYKINATPNGSATTPATTIAQSTPSLSGEVVGNNYVITASVEQKTQSITPTVTAGYISSGTAGTITLGTSSNTLNLPIYNGELYTPILS